MPFLFTSSERPLHRSSASFDQHHDIIPFLVLTPILGYLHVPVQPIYPSYFLFLIFPALLNCLYQQHWEASIKRKYSFIPGVATRVGWDFIQTAFHPIRHIHAFVYKLRHDRCAITIDALQSV
jgi:hypothetical protein